MVKYTLNLTTAQVEALTDFRDFVTDLADDCGELAEGSDGKPIFDAMHQVWDMVNEALSNPADMD